VREERKPQTAEVKEISQRAKLNKMCSDKEISDREELNKINIFEVDPQRSFFDEGLNRWVLKIHKDYAIKIFQRSAADKKMDDPNNLRPPSVLLDTINYLLNNIVDIDKKQFVGNRYFKKNDEIYTFKDICLFIEDRFRAIRQDFIILAQKGSRECIESHEKIARFLILALNECLDFPEFTGHQGLYNLLVEQLGATLTSLRESYEYVYAKGGSSDSADLFLSPNVAEFYNYSILLVIQDQLDLISMLNKIPYQVRESQYILNCRKYVRALLGREFTYFNMIKKADYLTACLMSLHLPQMRCAILESLCNSRAKGNKDTGYKTTYLKLCEMMLFEDVEECYRFLTWYGIDVRDELMDINPDSLFELEQGQPRLDLTKLFRKTNKRFIESKHTGMSRKDIIK
jgi:hypothetical protein